MARAAGLVVRRSAIWLRAAVVALVATSPACDKARKPTRMPRSRVNPTTQPIVVTPITPLPEFGGRIAHILLHSKDGLVGQASKPVYDLLGALEPGTRVTFVCDSDAARTETLGRMRQYGYDKRLQLETRRVPGPISVWPRDRYIFATMESPNGISPVCLVPSGAGLTREASRQNERVQAAVLFNGLIPGLSIAPAAFVLEGGNLLASGKQIFVGANVLAESALAADTPTAEQTRKRLADQFVRPVVLVSDESGNVPFVHIDMYMTVIADDEVLLASPALGAAAMEKADETSRNELRARLMGHEADASTERQRRFDEIARKLEAAGLKVTRLPYVDCLNGDFIVTYNNVLQETVDGRRVVYMPTYRVPALDAAARAAWEAMGREVRPIDVAPIAHLNGAVRCMANVINRKQP